MKSAELPSMKSAELVVSALHSSWLVTVDDISTVGNHKNYHCLACLGIFILTVPSHAKSMLMTHLS